jgi:hypothetical protein
MGQNIVQNPSFETGQFASWVVQSWGINSPAAHTGTNYAVTGCVGASCITPAPGGGAWFYQDLPTVPGTTYTLTFYYEPGPGSGAAELQVLWGPSATQLTTGGAGACTGNCVFSNTSIGSTTWNQFTVANLVATTNSTRLEFLGRQDPAGNGVDDVSVVAVGPAGVPLPPSFWLTLVGLSCIGFFVAWRRPAHTSMVA